MFIPLMGRSLDFKVYEVHFFDLLALTKILLHIIRSKKNVSMSLRINLCKTLGVHFAQEKFVSDVSRVPPTFIFPNTLELSTKQSSMLTSKTIWGDLTLAFAPGKWFKIPALNQCKKWLNPLALFCSLLLISL